VYVFYISKENKKNGDDGCRPTTTTRFVVLKSSTLYSSCCEKQQIVIMMNEENEFKNDKQWQTAFDKHFTKQLPKNIDDSSGPSMLSSKPTPETWLHWYLSHMRLPSKTDDNNNDDAAVLFSLAKTAHINCDDVDKFCLEALDTIKKSLAESLSSVQELVLDGDVDTTLYQIDRLTNRYQSTYNIQQEKSLLHYAVLTRNVEMIRLLLDKGIKSKIGKCFVTHHSRIRYMYSYDIFILTYIDDLDIVTKQTAFHLAIFTGSIEIL
jgi:hypothetical protein